MVSVLVVEDDDVSRELIASRLQRAGHEVRSVGSAPAARHQLDDALPDVLVSDMFMPGGSGLGLVADLRGDAGTAGLPVVFLSGRALPADVEAGLALGGSYLRKPFAVTALLEAVEEAADAPTRVVVAQVLARLADLGDLADPAERRLFRRLLTSFAEQAPAALGQLVAAARRGDAGEVQALAHRLAGGAANLGAPRLEELLRAAEDGAAGGLVPDAADLRPLHLELGVVRRALTAVAAELAER
ncbi:response regulator [Quadrisphaera sp. KR29]|uniref:response regulator n=1 Tax=Quadrisphaera sp. KR29 TaxID=3461391 RepID=UPI004043B3CF